MMDTGDFDHVTLAAPPKDPHDTRLWMYDVGFVGLIHRPVVEYPRPHAPQIPELVAVMRHRIEGWRSPVLANASAIATHPAAYDFERLLQLIFSMLTRFSSRLPDTDFGLLEDGAPMETKAAIFARGITDMFLRVENSLRDGGEKKICSEFVAEAFATFANTDLDDSANRYFGLCFPHEPINGLLSWLASHETFTDWISFGREREPQANSEPADDPIALLAEIRAHYDLNTQAVPRIQQDLDYGDLSKTELKTQQGEKERALRVSVEGAAVLVLDLLGRSQINADVAKEASALYVLDQFLRRGPIISPRSVRFSPSLYVAGYLDIEQLKMQLPARA
jgi:hypothetical protein